MIEYDAEISTTDRLPLLSFIDLLIVDEAGQVSPELAGAAFALARRALVVGDTEQLQPVPRVSGWGDAGKLHRAGLLAAGGEGDEMVEGSRAVERATLRRTALCVIKN